MSGKPEIIYQDETLIVLNKPAGMLSIPDRFDAQKPSLYSLLQATEPQVYIVHRLDKDTSGVIVFAKTAEAHQDLSKQFEAHETEKVYLALVDGVPSPAIRTIDVPIAHDPSRAGSMKVHPKGKTSITSFQVLESFGIFSLLEVRIQTGRTHQIRVHLSHIHHPLVVDPLYGRRTSLKIRDIKRKGFKGNLEEEERESHLLERTPLHAQLLRFRHPVQGTFMSFEAPLPRDFKACLSQMRKWLTPASRR